MSILYILDNFPSISETFIEREITELTQRGLPIEIVSLRTPPDSLTHQASLKLLSKTTYIPPLMTCQSWWSLLLFSCTSPFLFLKLLLLGLPFPLPSPRFFYHRLRGVLQAIVFYKNSPKADIQHIHAHFAYVTADVAQPLSILYNSTWSVSCHAWDIFTQKPHIIRSRIKSAHSIFTCSNFSYSATKRTEKHSKNIINCYHGLPTSTYIPEASSNTNHILSIGRLEEKKGFTDLIKACHILNNENIHFQCKIIGDGRLKKQLQQEIATLELTERITLPGSCSHDTVIKELNNANLFVLPCIKTKTGDHDGIPNVILEAMALEKAVITTPVGGIPEVITDNITGTITEPNNPVLLASTIKDALSNHDQTKEIGQNARQHILRNFDIQHTIKPLYNYLREQCKKHP